MTSTNFVEFAKGDIVCYRKHRVSFFGTMSVDLKDIIPMKVLEVIPDDRASERVGELGNSNIYRVQSLLDEKRISKCYQYQLVFWYDVKDSIIQELEDNIATLKNI